MCELHVTHLGIPTDTRFGEEVRDRARKLASKRPDFYNFLGYALKVSTTDDETYTRIMRWVLYNEGIEPE